LDGTCRIHFTGLSGLHGVTVCGPAADVLTALSAPR
jgi:hypothetical protein